MKLFDLLKSLNTGTVTDPDHVVEDGERSRVLDELHALLDLLDAPAPTAPVLAAIPVTEPDFRAPIATSEQASLFDLSSIFDSDPDDETAAIAAVAATPAPAPHRQRVRALLDELLPMLERALGDRLDQLDNDTLEQWQNALAQPLRNVDPSR